MVRRDCNANIELPGQRRVAVDRILWLRLLAVVGDEFDGHQFLSVDWFRARKSPGRHFHRG